MSPVTAAAEKSYTRTLAWIGLPAALLCALAASALVVLLFSTGAAQDDIARQNSEHRAATVIGGIRSVLEKTTLDYSVWDEAVDNLHLAPSRQWAEENLGAHLEQTYRIDVSVVIAPDGRAVFRHGLPEATDLTLLAGWAARAGPGRVVSAFAVIDGRLHLVAAGAITTFSTARAPLRGPHSTLVLARAIDQALLGRIAAGFILERLGVDVDAPHGDEAFLPFHGLDGEQVAHLHWHPERPGAQMIARLAAPVGGLVLIMLLLLALVVRRASRTATRLAESAAALREANEALEQRVAERTAKLEQASRAKSEFLANMSHELRTPLNAIIGCSDLMRQEVFGPLGSPKYIDHVNAINQSGSHLLMVIGDILDLSKIEAGKMTFNPEPVPLCGLLQQSRAMVADRAFHEGVLLEVRPVGPDLIATADRLRTLQALLNLLSNALKFTPPGGVVTVDCGGDDSRVWISVTDTGCGMTAEELELALQPFEQVGGANRRRHEGTGLGLPLARRFAELQGGTLTLTSRPGEGTAAVLALPRSPCTEAPTAAAGRLSRA